VGARRTLYVPAGRPVVTTGDACLQPVSAAVLYSIEDDVCVRRPSTERLVFAFSPLTALRESVTSGRMPIAIFAVSLAAL